MAAAAATAVRCVREPYGPIQDQDIRRQDIFVPAAAGAVAVYEVSACKAPAAAAAAVRTAGGRKDVPIAVAAAVAAAGVGWNFEALKKISKAAAETFSRCSAADRQPASTVARCVASAVKGVSSRLPAVEAAAEAAYAVCISRQLSAAEAVEAAAKAAAAAAFAHSDGQECFSYAADAAARASITRQPTADVAPPNGDAVTAAANATVLAADEAVVTAWANAVQAANAPDMLAANPANAGVAAANGDHLLSPFPEHKLDSAIAAAALSLNPASADRCFEAMPDSHQLTLERLKIIMEVDIFLAGFLLFSLTGRLREEAIVGGEIPEESPSDEKTTPETADDDEITQIVLQLYTFGVFLAATAWTAICAVGTGGRYALTSTDLLVPIVLSICGFSLLLVTVGDAIYIEIGTGYRKGDEYFDLYWTTVWFGLGISLYTVVFGMFVALYGYKFNWEVKIRKHGCWLKVWRVVHN